jgi:hypothetical protein
MFFRKLGRYLRQRRAAALLRDLESPERSVIETAERLMSMADYHDVRQALANRLGHSYEDVLKGLIFIDKRNWGALEAAGPLAIDALLLHGRYRAVTDPEGARFCEVLQQLLQTHVPHLREGILRNVAQMADLTERYEIEIPPTHDCGGGCPGIGCCNNSVHYSTYVTECRPIDCSAIRATAQEELDRRFQGQAR